MGRSNQPSVWRRHVPPKRWFIKTHTTPHPRRRHSQNLHSHLLSRNVKIKICKTIILPVVLFGCETWSLTLREKHRMRVFEYKVLRRIFGPKRR
jgi:hypothetical protein